MIDEANALHEKFKKQAELVRKLISEEYNLRESWRSLEKIVTLLKDEERLVRNK